MHSSSQSGSAGRTNLPSLAVVRHSLNGTSPHQVNQVSKGPKPMRIPFEDVEEFESRRMLMNRARQGDDSAKAILLARYKVTIYSEADLQSTRPTKKSSRGSSGAGA
jgi:hypothetical protein